MCCNMQPFLKVINVLFTFVMISIPIILIVLGTVDMFKAITSSDEKAVKEARGSLIKRVIYAVLIFLVPFIVRLVLQFTEEVFLKNDDSSLESPTSWVGCWNSTMNETINCSSCKDIYEEEEPSNQNPGNSDTEENTKTCYWWKMAVCDKETVLDNYNLSIMVSSKYRLNSGPIFQNNQAYCKYNIYPSEENDLSECNNLCNLIDGQVVDTNSCVCQIPAILSNQYSETLPSIAFGGKATVYKISSMSNCGSAPNINKPSGTISVPRQTK